MKLTIIVPDSAVYVDGKSYSNLTLTNIPANVRVLQWQGTEGHIEFIDGTSNQNITELPTWANDAKNEWDSALLKSTQPDPVESNLSETFTLNDAEKLEAIRLERTNRLRFSDWTQLSDAPSYINKEEWAKYRQALRDMLDSPTFDLNNPVYPISPVI